MKPTSLDVMFSAKGDVILSVTLPPSMRAEALGAVDNAHSLLSNGKEVEIDIREYKKRRSLDANGYYWALCNRLCEKLQMSPEEIYREHVKDVGGNYEVVCVKDGALDKLRKGWEHSGIGWITDTMPSKIEGCTNVMLYYGSSTYDTAQMSRLIGLMIDDCKANGIETKTPSELALLMSEWEGR